MRYLIYSIFIFGSFVANCQSNLVFYTEEGENFTLYVNGSQINQEPASRAKASGITGDFAQVKIIFETPGAPEIKKGIMMEVGKEMTSAIQKNNKGKYVLRPVSSAPIPRESETEAVPITNTTPPPTQTSTTASTQSSSTTSAINTDSETIGINMKVGDQSVGISVNMGGLESTQSNETQQPTNQSGNTQISATQLSARVEGKKIILSDGRVFNFNYYNANRMGPVIEMKNPIGASVTISYDGVESYSGEVPFQYNENDWKKSNAYFKLTVIEAAGTWSVKLKHSGKIIIDGASSQSVEPNQAPNPSISTGCASPMSDGNFNRSKESIEGKSFGDEKMTVFKQIVRANCFSVDQVIGFMELFTYEEEKLDVAKFAYLKTVDKGNYYQVNDALTYSDSVAELEGFLADQ
ncbi:DUF4476 domain-containing protein [Ekhidna sp.]